MLEKELIERSLKKDEKAFAALMGRYQDKIYQHILGIIKDEMIAEDIKQDTFLQAYQKLSTFRGDSSFYTWIYRIAHNKALNALREKKKKREEVLDERTATLAKKLESEWDWETLEKALEHLSIKQRETFELFFLKRMPQKQIASLLQVPLGTIRSRIFYAKKKIREYISEW